jgi:hypothetical protein
MLKTFSLFYWNVESFSLTSIGTLKAFFPSSQNYLPKEATMTVQVGDYFYPVFCY